MGASFGAQGLIARCVGQGRTDEAEHVAGQLVTLGVVFSAAVAVAGSVFAEPLLRLTNVSENVLGVGVPYVRLVHRLPDNDGVPVHRYG